MLNLFKKHDYPIALDLGSSSLKMVQLGRGGGTLNLQAAAISEVPEDVRGNLKSRMKWTVHQVKSMLGFKPFRGRKFVTCLPSSELLIQHLRMPKMKPEQLSKALAVEAQEKLPSEMAGATLRHIVAGEVYEGEECKQEIILLAASPALVQQHLYLIEQTKIEIAAISVEAQALINAFGNDETQLLIDMGHTGTKVIVSQGRQVSFCRNIDIAGVHMARPEPVGAVNEIQFSDNGDLCSVAADGEQLLSRLAGEVRGCVQYHDMVFPERPVERVVFSGGLANDTAFCQQLARKIGLPAQLGDPSGNINPATRSGKHSDLEPSGSNAQWAVALGLAQL